MNAPLLLAAGAAMLIGTAAHAADDSKHRDPNRKICRTLAETGSRLNRARACHTQAEWDELRRQTKAKIENIQNNRPWNAS
jgi:hypothetical protein